MYCYYNIDGPIPEELVRSGNISSMRSELGPLTLDPDATCQPLHCPASFFSTCIESIVQTVDSQGY